MITVSDIEVAHTRIKSFIRKTHSEKSILLSQHLGSSVYLKHEQLQKSGSFKLRGALNKILSLDKSIGDRGIVCASNGNHGLAVALAAKYAHYKATVFLSKTANTFNKHAIQSLGTKIVTVDGNCLTAETTARAFAQQENLSYISPYNDPLVIAGQGTLGIELSQDIKSIDNCFISVGGGGLISGIGLYLKAQNPDINIIACSPKNAPTMHHSLAQGKIIEVKESDTLSDATAGNVEHGSITFEICKKIIDDFILVEESEIKAAMQLIAAKKRLIIEGAAAVAVAGLIQQSKKYKDQNNIVVLCGRNIVLEKFCQAVQV